MSRRDVEKEQLWRDRIGRQASSGLSVRDFCREEKLGESAFFCWRRTLRTRDQAGKSVGDLERRPRVQARRSEQKGFVSLQVLPHGTPEAVIEVVLPESILLRVMAGCDSVTLREVLSALGRSSC